MVGGKKNGVDCDSPDALIQADWGLEKSITPHPLFFND